MNHKNKNTLNIILLFWKLANLKLPGFILIQMTRLYFYAKKKLCSFHEDLKWLLITATHQTTGKGQFDRKWKTPPGNVYATFVFPIETRDLTKVNLDIVLFIFKLFLFSHLALLSLL
jgi:hypothetical protein